MQIILEHIFTLVFFIVNFLCLLVVVFFERKNPASTIAWVLVLVFLPFIGFVAYLFLGSGFRISKRKKYIIKSHVDDLYDNYLRKHLNIADVFSFVESHDKAARTLNYLGNEGKSIYTSGNEAEIYLDGKSLFDKMIADIQKAESHIHLLYFIINNDNLGRKITDILTEKAKQGVEIRLIYDSLGSRAIGIPPMFKALRKAGGQVRGFSPLFSNTASRLRLNYRNHRKITVVDGSIAYVGGMNIGDEYLGEHKKLKPWRDTHLRLRGQSVWFLQERFLMDWSYADDSNTDEHLKIEKYFAPAKRVGNLGVQIVSSGPDTKACPLKSGILSMIYSARKNIYLQSPYFAPDESIMDALRIAARSKVDVRLMLPSLNDHWLSQMAALGYAREAVGFGVKVFLYNGFLHAKTSVSDSLVSSIGSANINNRSYLLDFEVNAFIYEADFAKCCEEIFLKDQENCIELSEEWFENKSRLARAGYNFSRIFAPLM